MSTWVRCKVGMRLLDSHATSGKGHCELGLLLSDGVTLSGSVMQNGDKDADQRCTSARSQLRGKTTEGAV